MIEKYHSLLLQNDLKLENYQEALNYAIDADEIRNIALSGSYGSGKSSVINSYEQMRKDKKFLHITLADFKEQHKAAQSSKVCAADVPKSSADRKSTDAEPDTNAKSTVDLLEGKILNQLLHQIDLKDIPSSRFRSKNTNPPQIDKKACNSLCLFYPAAPLYHLLWYLAGNGWRVTSRPSGYQLERTSVCPCCGVIYMPCYGWEINILSVAYTWFALFVQKSEYQRCCRR